MSEIKKDGWIPIEESAPETEKYIMVSFENCTLPDIAREEEEAAVDETTQKTDTGAERTDSIK